MGEVMVGIGLTWLGYLLARLGDSFDRRRARVDLISRRTADVVALEKPSLVVLPEQSIRGGSWVGWEHDPLLELASELASLLPLEIVDLLDRWLEEVRGLGWAKEVPSKGDEPGVAYLEMVEVREWEARLDFTRAANRWCVLQRLSMSERITWRFMERVVPTNPVVSEAVDEARLVAEEAGADHDAVRSAVRRATRETRKEIRRRGSRIRDAVLLGRPFLGHPSSRFVHESTVLRRFLKWFPTWLAGIVIAVIVALALVWAYVAQIDLAALRWVGLGVWLIVVLSLVAMVVRFYRLFTNPREDSPFD